MKVDLNSINNAAQTVNKVAVKTPLQYSERLSRRYQAKIYLKREDLQSVRSFKIRGAFNKMSALTAKERSQGVVCASAGNHAQGVAYSCSHLQVRGAIFMPTTTPMQKIDKVKNFGEAYVTVMLTGNTFDEASAAAKEYCKKNNMVFVHPFDDPLVISGQGTVAKEVYEELDGKLDLFLAAIGGGGLISGCATFLKEMNSDITVIGCEPDKAAGMKTSLEKGHVYTLEEISTFVDGAAVRTVGELTFAICKKYVDQILTLNEGELCTTMIELYQNEGMVTEPAGALTVSALESIKGLIKGKTVVCLISGGNNDILRYPEIMEKSLVYQGLKHYFIVNFAQKPGSLKTFVNKVLGPTDDIARFEYIKKSNKEKGPALIGIEQKRREDYPVLIKRMEAEEINFRVLHNTDILYDFLI